MASYKSIGISLDPNAVLAALRGIVDDVMRAADCDKVSALPDGLFEEVCILQRDLDRWLVEGGVLPTAWKGER